MASLNKISELLGENGPMVECIASFSPRPSQQQMASAVAEALKSREVLVCEAGTGTGKTFAYLVPALASDQKIIISTGTKNLQDQLFLRDLPVVVKAMDANRHCAMLKGRSNYICPYRLEQAQSGAGYFSPQQMDQLQRIRTWYSQSPDGDISGMREIAEDSPIWFQVTSTADNCLGQDCPDIACCPVVKARRLAQEADVVVINHYLLFSDMMLRDQGFGELLPGADALILDEAHQIPAIASDFFGQSLSSRQFMELINDSLADYQRDAADLPAFPDALTRLGRSVSELRQAMGRSQQRMPWYPLSNKTPVNESLTRLHEELVYVQHLLESLASRSKGLDGCWRRSTAVLEKLALFFGAENEQHICWCETSRHGFVLHETPIEIAEPFSKSMQAYDAAWIFTSATLSVGKGFEHFTARLGLQGVRTASWDSPFDFQRNACLYLPENMPQPASPGYVSAVIEASVPVIQACHGRTFILFTSYRSLHEAARQLRVLQLPYPLLVQGDAPRNELLLQFRSYGNAVLLGTGSFWEGVDVRGEALSCVIIDKLPFATPGDPVLQARAELMIKKGGNPFRDYQLPNAVIALKQGVGRLIRDHNDRGVMVLCDPRLTSKPYGRVFLQNLPAMNRIGVDGIAGFFASGNSEVAVNQDSAEGLSIPVVS